MEYKILIRKCIDPHSAHNIAREISRWAGASPEAVFNIITAKTVCIRKKTDAAEAVRLKARYEALGANVELVPVNGSVVLPVRLHTPSAKPVLDDDEEEEDGGRLLTDEEYAERLRERNDIFYFEGNRRLQYAETICLVCAIITGIFLSTREIAEVARVVEPDFYQREARLIREGVEPPPPPVVKKTEPEKRKSRFWTTS